MKEGDLEANIDGKRNERNKNEIKDIKGKKAKVNQSHYRPEVPRGFQEVKVPRLRDSGPGWW